MADAEYMRAYRKRYRQTPEGRAKLRTRNKRWKQSENGKKYNREWAKKKYVHSDRVLMTPEQTRARLKRYWESTAKPKRQRKWRDNMEHLKRYGLTKEQYLAMLADQAGGCAICGGTNGSSRNRQDHCHETGKVRGLLCDNCNKGIGLLKDDAAIVRKALLYLKGA